jgi:hypothetical protein
MMPYTQISNYGGNQLPPTLYFDGGTGSGQPDGGSAGGGKRTPAKKTAKKAAPKSKKKR